MHPIVKREALLLNLLLWWGLDLYKFCNLSGLRGNHERWVRFRAKRGRIQLLRLVPFIIRSFAMTRRLFLRQDLHLYFGSRKSRCGCIIATGFLFLFSYGYVIDLVEGSMRVYTLLRDISHDRAGSSRHRKTLRENGIRWM